MPRSLSVKHQLRRPGLLLPLFYLFTAVLLAGCGAAAKEPSAAPPAAAAPPAVPVDGSIIRPGSLKEELDVTGSLVANQRVDIVSELTRKIVRVNVKEGNFVKAGTLLFLLDDDDLQAQLEKLHQQEKLALLNEARLRDLIKHEAVVQQDYDQAFTNLKVLQAQIAELQVMIAKTRIKAPFDGQVGIIHVYPGAVVSVNTVLTHIEDNSVVKVEFSVPEKYASVITPGSTQRFTVASNNKQYTARVVARESKLDQNTRTLIVRAVSDNPGRVLLPGQSARLTLALHESENALMVSSQALIPSSQGYSVFVSKNNKVQLTPVQIGQRGPYTVEVLKGLQPGDTVVLNNLLRLSPGADVQFVTMKEQ
ncbi:MAG TPA: efflux RND transporter periplasmic adaptor subunit [Chitinophagaceae bacterium]|nr:efflux RND transporter periplasmic adaptor subunit [Chitinophagaceae bacterium]